MQAPAIDFLSLEDAIDLGMRESKVTVIEFTADWCGWCRKMRSTTFGDPAVAAGAGRFVFASVDIDDRPQVAAAFGVNGVPAVALLNAKGELLTQANGYHTPSQMLELLDAYADKAQVPGQARQHAVSVVAAVRRLTDAAPGEATDQALAELLPLIAQADRHGRAEAVTHIKQAGPRTWPGLSVLLHSDQLAIRAAAHDLLAELTEQDLAYDPFAEPDVREAQAQAWQAWVDAQADDNQNLDSDSRSQQPARNAGAAKPASTRTPNAPKTQTPWKKNHPSPHNL